MQEIGLEFYPYSLWYVFFEQYNDIKGLAIQNYFLSLIILFALVTIIYNFSISIMIVGLIIFTSSNLWSVIWLCNFIFPE